MTRQEQITKAATAKSRGETPYYYEAFVEGAEWADAHPHWISVADELPKDKEIVLVLTPDATFWCDVATYINGVEWLETFNGWTVPTKVTHWMHLPAPSKKGGNQ